MVGLRSGLALVVLLATSCGGRVVEEGSAQEGPIPTVTGLYVPDAKGCVARSDFGDSSALRRRDATERLAVVEVASADERCTGAGGHYILAREIESGRRFWLGGHGCRAPRGLLASATVAYGVVRYIQTARLERIPADLCVGFPDETVYGELSTDADARAIAVFASRGDAEAYVRAFGR